MHIQDEILVKYREILTNSPYDKMIKSWGASGNSFHCEVSKLAGDYKDSEYFYNGGNRFIHWTTVDALISIINSREIRLYNLFNSDDNEEFKYAAEKIGISTELIDHTKKYLFTWSFCEATLKNDESMWLNYGRDFKGVAFEFEIVNNPEIWKNYLISPVFYEVSQGMLETFERLENLKREYHNAIEVFLDLGKLIAFHKNPVHKKENEIRIANYFPFNDDLDYQKFCRKEFRLNRDVPTITSYYPLKL